MLKKPMFHIISIVLAVLAVLFLGPSQAFTGPQPAQSKGGHAAEEILVKFKTGTSDQEKNETHRKHGGQVIEVIPQLGIQVIRVDRDKEEEKKQSYKAERTVEFAELNYEVYAVGTPDDTYFGNQWGMTKIQAPEAWDLTTGSSAIKIAIADTGIDQDHEDLKTKIVANKNFTRSRTVDDKYGHGTHVAGIAAAATNNAKGVAGVGYNSVLMNVKVLGDNGSGTTSWVASGITWAADNGAKVINLSLGASSGSSTLENAVNYAWGKGVVIVAAAGNSNTSAPLYPAYYSNVIAVAATDSNDTKAYFSSYGTWVDVAAPGLSIYSTMPNHNNMIGIKNYGYLSGTSMATPHVAGVAALVAAAFPGMTNADIRAKIQGTTDPTNGFSTPLGRINAYRAVQ
ncbi:MAG: peptidase S8 [Chloroflexi bacterium]|nr:peptidase S8 [Chloroflexota bacterium]